MQVPGTGIRRRGLAGVLLGLSVLLLGACTGQSTAAVGVPDDPAAALPSIFALDAVRSTSAVANREIPVDQPLAGVLVSTLSGMAQFNSAAATKAFAVYRCAPESAGITALTADVFGDVWIMVADYDAGRWQVAGHLSGGSNQIMDLTSYADLTSPADYFYCAAVGYGEPDPGLGNLLIGLTLTYDIDLPELQTYYVATPGNGGSDLNPGTEALPWATLQHAADTVGPGDTVLAGPGDYTGFMLQQSGVTSYPVVFDGQGVARITSDNETTPDGINIEDWGEGAIHHVTVRGFTVTGATRAGIRFSGGEDEHAHHITIADNVCDQNGTWGIFCGFNDDSTVTGNECSRSGSEHGIYLSNSCKRYTCSHNILWGNNGCGIHNNGDLDAGGDGIMEYGYIEYNICYGNGAGGGSALNFDTVRHCYIRGNLAYGNHGSGISIYSVSGLGSADNYVINNTIIQPDDGRFCLNIKDGSTDTTVYNNIFFSQHAFRGVIDTTTACLATLDSDYNIVMDRFLIDDGASLTLSDWTAQTGQDSHSIIATPPNLFVNPAGQDFHLKPGSPALDAGMMLGVEFSPMPASDIDGTYRPSGLAMDIGAYELE